MDAIIDAQNLAWIRRLSTLRYAVKNVLIHAGWRGATFDEIATAVGYPAELVRDELVSNNDYVHCPGCDYWSTWRGGEPFVPKVLATTCLRAVYQIHLRRKRTCSGKEEWGIPRK